MVFACSMCGKTSHNPVDGLEGYCGYCHDWTGPEDGHIPGMETFDIDGNVVPFMVAGMWILGTIEYRRIGLDRWGEMEVSTVLMGWSQGVSEDGKPLIFETAVSNDAADYWCIARYPDKFSAAVGHMLVSAAIEELFGPRRLEAGQ